MPTDPAVDAAERIADALRALPLPIASEPVLDSRGEVGYWKAWVPWELLLCKVAKIAAQVAHPRIETPDQIAEPDTEVQFRQAMFQAETEGKYEDAALAALGLAEMVSVRTAEGATYCVQRAQVYATLHQAQAAVLVAENRRERMP